MKKTARYLVVAVVLIACVGYMSIDAKASVSGQVPPSGSISGQVPSGKEESTSQTTETTQETTTTAAASAVTSVLKATTESVFTAHSVPGVAATTPQTEISTAAGLQQGEKAKFYFGDVYKSEIKKALKDAAASVNANVECMLNIDLYALSKSGIRGTNTLTQEIQVQIALPKRLKGQKVTLVTIIDGKVCEFEDMDENPDTFTLSTKNLGAFAVVTK